MPLILRASKIEVFPFIGCTYFINCTLLHVPTNPNTYCVQQQQVRVQSEIQRIRSSLGPCFIGNFGVTMVKQEKQISEALVK